MGNVHAHRGRSAPAIILAVLMAVAVIVTLGLAAGPAGAQAKFTTCATCHDVAGTHAGTTHSATGCANCHVNGLSAENKGVTSAACVSCHTDVAATLANTTHAANACGTTPGCHGVAPLVAKTTMTLKAPRTVKVRKSAKFTGKAGPVPALAGAKVAFKVERKVGKKWVKMKAASTKVKATGAFTWTYKTTKKGAHRVTASIAAKANTYTTKKVVKNFKVN